MTSKAVKILLGLLQTLAVYYSSKKINIFKFAIHLKIALMYVILANIKSRIMCSMNYYRKAINESV